MKQKLMTIALYYLPFSVQVLLFSCYFGSAGVKGVGVICDDCPGGKGRGGKGGEGGLFMFRP